MTQSRLLSPLIIVAALMLVVSVALAAVLLSGGGSDDDGDTERAQQTENLGVAPTLTPTLGAGSLATTTPVPPTATPDIDVPASLRARFDALPEKLRNQVIQQREDNVLGDEGLEELIAAYENRNNSLRVGSVLQTDEDSLQMEVYTTGEQVDVAIDSETVMTRAGTTISLADLQPEELVMVVSMDEGVTAFSIQAFGVELP